MASKRDKHTLENVLVRAEQAIREGDYANLRPEKCRARVKAVGKGSKAGLQDDVIFQTLMDCVVANRRVPEWLRREVTVRHLRGLFGKFRSWDEAFGRPSTAAQASRDFRELFTAHDVMDLVVEARLAGIPIDNGV